jgi:hypothetical protein
MRLGREFVIIHLSLGVGKRPLLDQIIRRLDGARARSLIPSLGRPNASPEIASDLIYLLEQLLPLPDPELLDEWPEEYWLPLGAVYVEPPLPLS